MEDSSAAVGAKTATVDQLDVLEVAKTARLRLAAMGIDLVELEGLADSEWSNVIEAVDTLEHPFGIDWHVSPEELGLGATLERLARIKALLPDDNEEKRKSTHNKTLENHIKLAFYAAGNVRNLQIFMHLFWARLQCPPVAEPIAQQALWLWAPAAEITGDYWLKTQLEEAAFELLYPQEKTRIEAAYAHMGERAVLEDFISQYAEDVGDWLSSELYSRCQVNVSGRAKSPYSVWRKGQQKGGQYDITDFFGLRAIISPLIEGDETAAIGCCYAAKTLMEDFGASQDERFKDYIKSPKPSGYQGLHLTIKDDSGRLVEVQIRTEAMHEAAERQAGTSHLAYEAAAKKTPGRYFAPQHKDPTKPYKWREAVARAVEQDEGLDTAAMMGERLFVFGYDGNLYELSSGDTALDFAFKRHNIRALGTQGISINGLPRGFSTPIGMGDLVEVRKDDEAAHWKPDWFEVVNSKVAKQILRVAWKKAHAEELIEQGINKINRYFRARGIENPLEQLDEATRAWIAKRYDFAEFDLVLREVGFGSIGLGRIQRALEGVGERRAIPQKLDDQAELRRRGLKLLIGGASNSNFKIAGCCQGLSGELVARPRPSEGVFAVHISSCANVANDQKLLPCSLQRL
jgi:GTP diphosphokinase / guanosine-3',5'-bis(diphosphate) 3'-diphosphatase